MIKGIFYTAAFCGLSAGGAFGLAYVHDIMDRTPASVVSVPMDVPTPAVLETVNLPTPEAAPAARIEQASLPTAPSLDTPLAEPEPVPAPVLRATPRKSPAKVASVPAKPAVTQKKSRNVVSSISTRATEDGSFSRGEFDDRAFPGARGPSFAPVTRFRGPDADPTNRLVTNWQTGVFR